MQSAGAGTVGDALATHHAVELREDVPLKGSSSGSGGGCGWCGAASSGPRLIAVSFTVLSAAITVALLAQVYAGDVQLVPHGAVSTSAAACSRAGTDALKGSGSALDAALAAALCLAVVAPHRSSLDASGSLLYWEYRKSRSQLPLLVQWGAANESAPPLPAGAAGEDGEDVRRAPRLVRALAALHATRHSLPWHTLLQPAILLARNGFEVSEELSVSARDRGQAWPAGTTRSDLALAQYLESLQNYTSTELLNEWGEEGAVHTASSTGSKCGAWRVFAGGAAAAVRALCTGLSLPQADADTLQVKIVNDLQSSAALGVWSPSGVTTGLAVVDRFDTYVALVTGLSTPFGSGPLTPEGWTRDEPKETIDLAPAIIVDENVCGTRYVMGAESSAALAQGASAACSPSGDAASVERARVALVRGGALAAEQRTVVAGGGALPAVPALPVSLAAKLTLNVTSPLAAVNVVQQRADALLSHADSRGGGLSSRF